MSNGRRILSAACLVVAVGGWAGCSHDTLKSGTAGFTVSYVASPAGAGRYERGSLGIASIQFLPTDPERASLYGTVELSLAPLFVADLTSSDPVAFPSLALAPGDYTVTRMVVVPPNLADNNPPVPPASCIENIAVIPSGPASGDVPNSYAFDETDGFRFTVRPDQTKVDIRVDVPALIAGYEAAFTCGATSCSGEPCLTAFDSAAFRDVLKRTITIK